MKTEYKIGIAIGLFAIGAVVGGGLYRKKKNSVPSEPETEIKIYYDDEDRDIVEGDLTDE